jgi:hypothetical protein
MKYDKAVKVIRTDKISDGMGGYEVTPVVVVTVNAFTTPVKAELALKEYGLVTTTSMKIFTKETLPADFDYLEYDNKKYKVLQLSDFGKIRMLLVEVIENG